MLRHLDIEDLQSGMVMVRITKQNGPVNVNKSGLVTSQGMVQGLIEMGVLQVEIDPDQTVEVEAPKIKKSATRRMLESNKVNNTRIDDSLSEQFHRSLFLPSVQGIPSAWQFYTKRYLLAAFIGLGGLGLGWTLANYQGLLRLLSPLPVSSPAIRTAPAIEQLGNDVDADSGVIANELRQQVTVVGEDVLSSAPSEVDQTNISTPNLNSNPNLNLNLDPNPRAEPEPQISADVLARFRKAMTEVEDSPVISAPVQRLSSNEDVPRIDQLPPWVMTRLPSMAFSVHMYASVGTQRWVRVNGSRMVEGDKIDGMIEIIRIEPQHVILNYSGQTFSMAALTDW